MLKSTIYLTLGLTVALSGVARAENIIDAHLKAIGGADAIAKIKSIHRTGSISGKSVYGPLSGTIEEIIDLSKNRGYTSMELIGYSRQTGWTGDSGWVSDSQAGVTDMPEEEASFAKYQGGPSPLALIHAQHGPDALKAGGDKDFNGKNCTVITVEAAQIEFFVNAKTKLLEGMSIPGNATVSCEDYKAVDGVQFPGKLTMQLDAQNMTMVYEFNTTKVNGEIDAAKFKMPSSHSTQTPAKPASGSVAAKQIISYMDNDGDGKISKNEAPEEVKTNFQYIDTNGDGAIDLKEAKVIAEYANKSKGE